MKKQLDSHRAVVPIFKQLNRKWKRLSDATRTSLWPFNPHRGWTAATALNYEGYFHLLRGPVTAPSSDPHRICAWEENSLILAAFSDIWLLDIREHRFFNLMHLPDICSIDLHPFTWELLIATTEGLAVARAEDEDMYLSNLSLHRPGIRRGIFFPQSSEKVAVVAESETQPLFDIVKDTPFAEASTGDTAWDVDINHQRNIIAYGHTSSQISLFDMRTNCNTSDLLFPSGNYVNVKFCGSALLAAGNMQGNIVIFDVRMLKEIDSFNTGIQNILLLYNEKTEMLFAFEIEDRFHALKLHNKGIKTYYTFFQHSSACFSQSKERIFVSGGINGEGLCEFNITSRI